ncbi:helix-turn-helix domain-containing protein [Streptococcus constellatus]
MKTEKFQLKDHIARRVRTLRTEKNLSQEKLTEMADLGNNYLYKLENKRLNARLDTIDKLVEALDVSPAEFFNFPPSDSRNHELYELMEEIEELPAAQKKLFIKGVRILLQSLK